MSSENDSLLDYHPRNDRSPEQNARPHPNVVVKVKRKLRRGWREFEKFVDRGNVIHLAVGLMMGQAFTSIVTSFVEDLFTPIFGLLLPNTLSEAFVVIKKGKNYPYHTREAAKEDGAVTWNYGNFLQVSGNFFTLSMCLFFMIRLLNKLHQVIVDDVKQCTECFSKMDKRAKKCPQCGARAIGES